MRLKIVHVPSIADPIKESPGFAKKLLSDYKLDVMGLCGSGCSYCSSNEGNYLRINRGRFAAITKEQTGEDLLPARAPELTFTWPDVIPKLEAQLARKPKAWGAGKTLVLSMLTDAFSPPPLADGTTERAIRLVLERTSFRIRALTKSAVVGTPKWIEVFKAHPGRFVVGLSTGTLDNEWARRVEIGTSSPSARLKALRALQDAGVPTFGMLCPVFPDALARDGLERLVDAIRPELCEHVWAEPYNDRANWRAVRAGYEEGTDGYTWMTDVFEGGQKDLWSEYAAELYVRLRRRARADGWLAKLRYLLYEDGIDRADAPVFAGLAGVLLQSKPGKDGLSANQWMRQVQKDSSGLQEAAP